MASRFNFKIEPASSGVSVDDQASRRRGCGHPQLLL
jgi:hypothetical protein